MRGERGKPQQDPRTGTIEDETALDTGARRDDATTFLWIAAWESQSAFPTVTDARASRDAQR